jgi:hypothetical protein
MIRWRVVDDPLEWLLQRQQGRLPDGGPRWWDKLYVTSRHGLRLFIEERCGEVDPGALKVISKLSERHPGPRRAGR